MTKKIAVFTGNRAEFGLLLPVIKEIDSHSELELQLFVSGAHLEDKFGKTIEIIESNGIKIAEEIHITLNGDDLFSTSMAIGEGIKAVSLAIKKHTPDILMVYADRFEGFAATVAGSQMGIPVAHLEGGDITEGGALDDSIRHAMTKLSHLHFTTNEDAYHNVIKMGEEPWRVANSGLPSIDQIKNGVMTSEEDLCKNFNLDLSRPLVVFTQHSVTTEFNYAREQIQTSLKVIRDYLKKGFQFIMTYPNNDAGGRQIIDELEKFAKENACNNLTVVPTVGGKNYHGLLSLAENMDYQVVCMGNSSSGIKETPIFKCPTINVGSRQNGRLQAKNVINVGYDENEIAKALETCVYDKTFRNSLADVANPYGEGDSARKIVDVLEKVEITKQLIQKKHIF